MRGHEAQYTALARHWLALANGVIGAIVVLSLVAPLALALGAIEVSDALYGLYSALCHQWAHRSFFVLGPHASYSLDELSSLVSSGAPAAFLGSQALGYKVAFCERDLAIYGSMLLAGAWFASNRSSVHPLAPRWYVVLLLPIAVDGLTQLVGWRESTPLLRVLTGAGFGVANVWLVYPRLDLLLHRAMHPASSRSTSAARAAA